LVEAAGVSFVDNTGLGVTSGYKEDTSISPHENHITEICYVLAILNTLARHWEHL